MADDEPSTSGRYEKQDKGGGASKKRTRGLKLPKAQAYLKDVQDKKLKGKLRYVEKLYTESRSKAAKVQQWLTPEDTGLLEAEGIEQTWQFQQPAIAAAVSQGAAKKAFDLELGQLGPYRLDITRNGRWMLLGGHEGHLAMFDWQRSHLACEVQVRETVHDVTFLHNEQFWAAAQRKYAYIYDKRGIEVHCLKEHAGAKRLEFLPHHFLLASVGEHGTLCYQDTSVGKIVAQHRTRLGACEVLRQNPSNAVLCLGHARGTVTMWTPNITSPVVKMLCHHGAVKALAIDTLGRHMVSSGVDGQVKVWDLRTLKLLHSYFANSPATSLDISQKGLLAVVQGRRVQVWKDALSSKAISPYMTHSTVAGIADCQFCPYEDVLGLGHGTGVSTMLVPGAGEPHYDSYVANPFQTTKERREAEVASLLDKLQPETIMWDPDSIGKVLKEPVAVQQERKALQVEANRNERRQQEEKNDAKTKMKGKNKPSRRNKKKQSNIIEERKPDVLARIKEQEERRQAKAQAHEDTLATVPRALHRFYKG